MSAVATYILIGHTIIFNAVPNTTLQIATNSINSSTNSCIDKPPLDPSTPSPDYRTTEAELPETTTAEPSITEILCSDPFALERHTPPPNHGTRRDGYTYTSGIGAHKVYTEGATWYEAWKICRDEGGHLAIVNSVAEAEIITKLISKSRWHIHVNYAARNLAHIGFHDLCQPNQWVTIHGQSLEQAGYSRWRRGEPNHYSNMERCGSIYEDGTLNDFFCDRKLAYICELPYIES